MKYPLNKYKFFVRRKTDGTPYGVVAVSTYAGKKVRGVSTCDPKDTFSIDAGKKLAAARCNEKIAQKRMKRAYEKLNEAYWQREDSKKHFDKMNIYYVDAVRDLVDARDELEELEKSM